MVPTPGTTTLFPLTETPPAFVVPLPVFTLTPPSVVLTWTPPSVMVTILPPVAAVGEAAALAGPGAAAAPGAARLSAEMGVAEAESAVAGELSEEDFPQQAGIRMELRATSERKAIRMFNLLWRRSYVSSRIFGNKSSMFRRLSEEAVGSMVCRSTYGTLKTGSAFRSTRR